jgi:WLM domain
MKGLIGAILAMVLLIIIYFNKPPPLLTALKERYERLLWILNTDPNLDPRWNPIKRRVIITAMNEWNKSKGAIGFNVNKGYEIYICMDMDPSINPETRINTAMHVLIHELCHTSVTEYEHSSNFWKNFRDFKDYCSKKGLYTLGNVGPYCGEDIKA